MKATGATLRSKLIRKCKTLQKRVLVMPDDDYRAMLEERYKVSSTADLNDGQLKNLCAHLDTLTGQTTQKPSLPDAQAQKIWVLWQELHKAGAVRDPSEVALNAYTQRMTRSGNKPGVASYRWLNRWQASGLIEALKKWLKRVEGNNE
jgi:phage gp16-like protein